MTRPAVFLDKDGTLVENVPYNVDPALLRFTPNALPALKRLAQAGFALIVVSNQSGIASGRFDIAALTRLQFALCERVEREAGVVLDGFFYCPHGRPLGGRYACACRKPQPGLLEHAAQCHEVDLAASWMIGDILDDVEAGNRAGCRTVLLDRGSETEWLAGPHRTPTRRCGDLLEAASLILATAQPHAAAALLP